MTTAEYNTFLNHRYGVVEKPRAKRFTGPKSQAKAKALKVLQWEKEQAELPGVFLPGLRCVNELNVREFWAQRQRRAKQHRTAVVDALTKSGWGRSLPCKVTLTRYGPRKMDEGCGNNASLKHARDGVADYLGVDDGDLRLDWQYRQELGPGYGVRILIGPRQS